MNQNTYDQSIWSIYFYNVKQNVLIYQSIYNFITPKISFMNYFSHLLENTIESVGTAKSKNYFLKKIQFLSLIFSRASDHETKNSTQQLSDELLVAILLYLYKPKIFFHKEIYLKTSLNEVTEKQKIIITKNQNYIKFQQGKLKNNVLQKLSSLPIALELSERPSNNHCNDLLEINVLKIWNRKNQKSQNVNNIFKKTEHLQEILKNVHIDLVSDSKNTKIINQKDQTYLLICDNKQIILNQIECLKSYKKQKPTNLSQINKIISLLRKKMIFFTIRSLDQKPNNKTTKVLLILDPLKKSKYKIQISKLKQEINDGLTSQLQKCTPQNNSSIQRYFMPFSFNQANQKWQLKIGVQQFFKTNEINQQKGEFLDQNGQRYYLDGFQIQKQMMI